MGVVSHARTLMTVVNLLYLKNELSYEVSFVHMVRDQ